MRYDQDRFALARGTCAVVAQPAGIAAALALRQQRQAAEALLHLARDSVRFTLGSAQSSNSITDVGKAVHDTTSLLQNYIHVRAVSQKQLCFYARYAPVDRVHG